jgi:hypothetical protein
MALISYFLFVFTLIIFIRKQKNQRKQRKQNKKIRASVENINEKKFWAYSKSSRKQSWQKLKCTLENSQGKKSEYIRSQVKSVQMNIKQHVLRASKNGQTRKKWKKNKKRNGRKKFYPSFLFNRFLLLYFCIYIKIPISVTRSWRDLIELKFLVIHIIIFFLFGLRFLFIRNRRDLIRLGFLVI